METAQCGRHHGQGHMVVSPCIASWDCNSLGNGLHWGGGEEGRGSSIKAVTQDVISKNLSLVGSMQPLTL
jgi:hypothetical protein